MMVNTLWQCQGQYQTKVRQSQIDTSTLPNNVQNRNNLRTASSFLDIPLTRFMAIARLQPQTVSLDFIDQQHCSNAKGEI